MDNLNEMNTTQNKKGSKLPLIIVAAIVAVAVIAGAIWAITSFVKPGIDPENCTPDELLEYSLEKTLSEIEIEYDDLTALNTFYAKGEVDFSKADEELFELPDMLKDFKFDFVGNIDNNDINNPKIQYALDVFFKNSILASADFYATSDDIILDAGDILGKAYGVSLEESNDYEEILKKSFLNPANGSDYALDEETFSLALSWIETYMDSIKTLTNFSVDDKTKPFAIQLKIVNEALDTFKKAFFENAVGVIENQEIDLNAEKLPVYTVKYTLSADGLANIVKACADWFKTSEAVKEYLALGNFEIYFAADGGSMEDFWAEFDESMEDMIAAIREESVYEYGLSVYVDQKTLNVVGGQISGKNTQDETDYADVTVLVHVNEENNVKVGWTLVDADNVTSCVFEYVENNETFVLSLDVIDDADNTNLKYTYYKANGSFDIVLVVEGEILTEIKGQHTVNGSDNTLVIDTVTTDGETVSFDFITFKWGKGEGVGEIPEYTEILKLTTDEFDTEMVSIYGALMGFIGNLPTELLMLLM